MATMPGAAKNSQTLSRWIERTIVLPYVVAAPGPIRLALPMRAIADAIGDPKVERVSVLKSARVGFSTVITAAIGYHVDADPSLSNYLRLDGELATMGTRERVAPTPPDVI
jgi:phage terminase large subunit GpA-like protein